MCLSHNGFCTNVLHAYKNGHKVISYFALFTRDTVLARELAMGLCLCHVCVSVCLSVCHTPVLYRNGSSERAVLLHIGLLRLYAIYTVF